MASVGMIGLGAMGSAMSGNLLRAGFEVVGHDIDGDRVDALVSAGGVAASSAADVAARAPFVVTSLPSAAALDAVVVAIAAAGADDRVVIETSTLPIAVKQRNRDALAAAGVTLLDCPLSGTGAQALHKDVVVYASGPSEVVAACSGVFDGFARAHYDLGEFGAGSTMKFIANLLVAIHNVAAAEAFVLGTKAGLDPETLVRVIGDGAGTSRMFEVRAPTMVTGDYSTGITVDVFSKDVGIIAEFAGALQCPVPLFAASAQLYAAARAQGLGDQDTAAVCTVLERLAGAARDG